ncbi:unnamed protein product, partial [Sphagnum balticum]
ASAIQNQSFATKSVLTGNVAVMSVRVGAGAEVGEHIVARVLVGRVVTVLKHRVHSHRPIQKRRPPSPPTRSHNGTLTTSL